MLSDVLWEVLDADKYRITEERLNREETQEIKFAL